MTLQTPVGAVPVDDVGAIGILNVGTGDTKLSFDPSKPAERERAAKVVEDMLQRGYAILVQVGTKDGKPLYMRAEGFDPETCEYLIVGLPETISDARATESADAATNDSAHATPRKKRGRKPNVGRVPASSTRATAVARSAGG